jgi:hypothetical protein
VVEALTVGVRRRQDQLVGHFVRIGRTLQTPSVRIGLLPACSFPLLLAPLGLLHATAFSVLGTHQQMMQGRRLTTVDGA